LENGGRGRRLRRGELGRGRALDRDGLVVVGEVQRAFDRRHRGRDRIRRRILFCHRLRLTPSAPDRSNDRPASQAFPPAGLGRTKRRELTTLQSTAAPQRFKPRRSRILQTSLTLWLPCFSIVFSRLSAAP